ncbi:glycosyltransferase [Patescibacteria group bacterium]|nr:glycosyltransferase [Patescibacteria group bacterium]
MKVALVHDFLNQVGGAEKVLQVFHELFPKAPVFTITYDRSETGDTFDDMDVRTSFIQNLPGGPRRYKWYLGWMPAAIEQFDLSSYDVVLSDCSAYSKGVVTKPETLHICYCHSPTRYLWSDTHSYTEELKQPSIIKKGLPIILNRIRLWDRQAAERVDNFITNSENVADRIKKYYYRDSDVIYPPVEVSSFNQPVKPEDYYLIVSRLRPYKRVDLAIEAFNALEFPLKVVGTGEESKKLKKLANDNIEFLGPVSDEEKNKLLASCKGFIHPQEEDFGIAAVEAMAAGRPVIAYKKGGALETVVEGVTGEFFEDQTPWSLVDTVREFKADKYDPVAIQKRVADFDTSIFKKKIKNYVEEAYQEHQQKLGSKL